MSGMKSRLQVECERMVAAEAVMRGKVTALEQLYPQVARQTAEIRHAMIDFLACVNNIQVTIAAKRQTGEESALVRQEEAVETPLFLGMGDASIPNHALASAATAQACRQDAGAPSHDHAFASAATGVQRTLMPEELMRMEASLHRAGDHSLDPDPEAEVFDRHVEIEGCSPEINFRHVAKVNAEPKGGHVDA